MHRIITCEALVSVPFGDESRDHVAGYFGAIEPPVNLNPAVVEQVIAGQNIVDVGLPTQESALTGILIGSTDERTVIYGRLQKPTHYKKPELSVIRTEFANRIMKILDLLDIEEVDVQKVRAPFLVNI